MKNLLKSSILILMLFLGALSNAQTLINLDTLSKSKVDTIHFCGSLEFITNSGDTVEFNNAMITHNHPYRYTSSNGDDSTLGFGYGIGFVWTSDTTCSYLNLVNKVTEIVAIKNVPNANLLCFATIDTSSMHAIIAFDTAGTSKQNIDSVYLYFYNSLNKWEKIGAKSYSIEDTAEYFVDEINDPNATPQLRYAVRTTNTCGDTSAFSNYQQTMYISASGGTFSWPATGYQIQGNATPVLTYYLVRNDTIIDSVGGNSSVIIDPDYSATAVYYVEAKLNEPTCNLSAIAMGKRATPRTINNTSRSNKLRNGAPAGIDEVSNSDAFKVYPNPSNGSFSLDIPQESDVRVYDIMGQTIFQSRLQQGHNQIDIKGADGIYLISVNGVFNKIIKE